jgi:hypothetical protein
LIGAETDSKTIAAMHSQCRYWVNNCRAMQPRRRLLHPQKLPRLMPTAAAVKGHKRHFAVRKNSKAIGAAVVVL